MTDQQQAVFDPLKIRVVIAGGGTAGWLAAAAISKLMSERVEVTLIESERIGRVGVGEATIPPLRTFHKLLGIDEQEFMRETQATFKLGIEFANWAERNAKYFHSFGVTGKGCWACDFQHFWVAGKQLGIDTPFGAYCPELVAAKAGKMLANHESALNYAYHLDAGLYAKFLQKIAAAHHVKHIEGVIDDVTIDPNNGYIHALTLDDGSVITGDLFIDCTGFKARLIEQALNTGFESYAPMLPCDSAVAVQTSRSGSIKPYTQATAHDYGWQWRMPLQHRAGNGLVYCSRYVSDDEAITALVGPMQDQLLSEPKMFRYQTGRRLKTWNKNCVALGLASGFLEPVESTSIHLIMSSILRLLKFFPLGEISKASVDEYNRQSQLEMEQIRNFLVLHYHATERNDSPFWRYCKNMDIPKTLENRINIFRESGVVSLPESELFLVDSWTQVMIGQNIIPSSYHPIVEQMPKDQLAKFLLTIQNSVNTSVDALPTNDDFIRHYCAANTSLNR